MAVPPNAAPTTDDSLRMDSVARRAIMACFSAPTNPVPGVVLRHIVQRASYASIRIWEKRGWIAREDGEYVLTAQGAAAMQAPTPTPPESFFPVEYHGRH